MVKIIKTGISFMLIIFIIVASSPSVKAYVAPVDTVKIGLYYGSNVLPSANLQNVAGYGCGYEFGYFTGREYISVANTDAVKISILRDRNMYFSGNAYYAGAEGSIVVGCYHIQLNTDYNTYEEAKIVSDTYASAYVKYLSGVFYVCIGNYTTSTNASSAATSLGLSNYAITGGTAYTLAVVETGTNNILFEFDYGTTYSLGVVPISTDGVTCQTWFKNYKYYGGFQYTRIDGGDITVVNFVNIEDYVKGVIPYEMSGSWPKEALKAQALCARTYVMSHLNKHQSYGFDVCNTTCCQVYYGTNLATTTSDTAVDETAGKYIVYNDVLCETYYSSSDGGASENSENVWSSALAYLRGVLDPYETNISGSVSNYHWTVTYTASQLTTLMRNKGYNCSTIVSFAVTQFTEVGNVYKISMTDSSGKTFSFTKGAARTALGFRSQRYNVSGSDGDMTVYVNDAGATLTGSLSTYYAIGASGSSILPSGSIYAITGGGTEVIGETDEIIPADSFTVTGTGYGHNVGMSQWGAYSMAKYYNMTYDQIIKFYYSGVSIG